MQPLATFGKVNPYFDVITLNYDACVETVLDNANVPWTDGFSEGSNKSKPDFSAASYDSNSCVQLVKLHGSVTWYERSDGNIAKTPSYANSQDKVAKFFGKAQTMANNVGMVYPTLNKGLTHGPFPKLFAEAQDILAKASLCVAVGYSFGDSHVRRIVIDAMRENEGLRLVLVTPKPWAILVDLDSDAEHLGVQERIGCVFRRNRPPIPIHVGR